jgi:hypothetical protein
MIPAPITRASCSSINLSSGFDCDTKKMGFKFSYFLGANAYERILIYLLEI